jgi:putative methionine-R-sulfoxide reductase with GAF domain
VEEVSRVGLELCEALDYLHAQHIVHRDVKPDNVILCPDRGAVLVDFGIARQFTDVDEGTIGIGTPRYMAPEVFAGGIVSARSDVFGLAATLWTMATGAPPMYGDMSPLDEVPGLSDAFKHAIRGGLAIDPHERLPSAAAMAVALGGALEGHGQPLARVVTRPTASRTLLEALVRAAAVAFEVAAVSLALVDERRGELVYEAAWGTGADEIVGVRLAPGEGIAGAIAAGGEAETVADCRSDPRFARQVAAGTGFLPHTMMVMPLVGRGAVLGVLQFLDRRDGESFDSLDLERAEAFAELAIHAVRAQELTTQPGDERKINIVHNEGDVHG